MFLRRHGWSQRDYDDADQDTVDLIRALDNEAAEHANRKNLQAQREQAAAAHRARVR